MIFLQLAVLLICIFIGSRMSGIGLGVMGMIGLLILLFVFGMQPADPPLEVMLIILSVVTAAAALQAAGGMDYLVNLAARILRKHRADYHPGPAGNLLLHIICRYSPYFVFYTAHYCRGSY